MVLSASLQCLHRRLTVVVRSNIRLPSTISMVDVVSSPPTLWFFSGDGPNIRGMGLNYMKYETMSFLAHFHNCDFFTEIMAQKHSELGSSQSGQKHRWDQSSCPSCPRISKGGTTPKFPKLSLRF